MLIMGVLVFQSYFAKLSFENQIPPREILTLEETMLYTHQYQRIHDLFLLVAISKTIVVYITWLYWQWYTEDGDRESTVRVVENLSYAVSECILFCALLLLAHGWCILAELNSNEVRALSSSLVALLSSLLFFSFYDIITSLLVLYIFLLPNIFSNISQNIECLKFRILWVEAVEDQIQEEDRDVWVWTLKSLQIKLDVFKRIRVLIAGYFFLLFVSKISPYFLPWYLEFLGAVFHEGLVLLFIGAIFFLIAPYRAKEGLFGFIRLEKEVKITRPGLKLLSEFLNRFFFFFLLIFFLFCFKVYHNKQTNKQTLLQKYHFGKEKEREKRKKKGKKSDTKKRKSFFF